MTNINTFQGDVFIHEYIKHTGDENNLFGFSGTDTFKIATAGVDRLTVDSGGSVTLGANMVIPDYIYHTGDVDTYFGFPQDGFFEIRTDGAVRMTVGSDGQVDLTGYLRIPNYIYHVGDADTYFGFSGEDTIVLRTGGTDRLTINNSAVAVAGTLTATKVLTPLIEYGGALTVGSAHNYATDVRGGGTVKFTVDNVQRGVFNVSGLTFQNGGTALNYFREETGPGWGAVGQNGTGFNINGGVKYQRVGNFVSMLATKVQFYAFGNFYMRHTIPAAFRPTSALGTNEILPWVTRVTTNSSYGAMAYCQNEYIYHVGAYNGSHFAAGSGTQHTFDAHQAVWGV